MTSRCNDKNAASLKLGECQDWLVIWQHIKCLGHKTFFKNKIQSDANTIIFQRRSRKYNNSIEIDVHSERLNKTTFSRRNDMNGSCHHIKLYSVFNFQISLNVDLGNDLNFIQNNFILKIQCCVLTCKYD